MRASGVALEHLLADRLEQVRLAEPDAAVDEQRVVRLARLLARRRRDAACGRRLHGPVTKLSNVVVRVERQRLVAVVEHAAARAGCRSGS